MKMSITSLRKLIESDMQQAESVIAARSFSQELQDMIQRLGRLMNEDLPSVSERMRNTIGPDVATAFEDQTVDVLSGVIENLRAGKQQIDNSVAEIGRGEMPSGGDGAAADEGDDLDFGDDDLDLGDDLDGGKDGALDLSDFEDDSEDTPPEGRAHRESVENLKNKIIEMQKKLTRARALSESRKVKETAFDRDLDDSKPVVVRGVRGMNSKSFTKKFKNMAAYEKWADSEAAEDYEVQQVENA